MCILEEFLPIFISPVNSILSKTGRLVVMISTHSCIKITKQQWLLLAGNYSSNSSFLSCEVLRIAAYILMRLIGPLEVWTWRVRINHLHGGVFDGKAKLCSLSSSAAFPCQANV